MAAVTTFLNAVASNPFLDSDVNWRQFISDHRNYIRASANAVVPSGEVLSQYKYDLKRWLRSMNYDVSLWWIVLKINDLDSDMDFSPDGVLSVIYVPTVSQISTLYQLFLTTSANRITDPLGE